MEHFIIPATKYTPLIDFHFGNKLLKIEGESYPENAMDTFQPLIEKLDLYFGDGKKELTIELSIDYLNTSSSKMVTDVITKFQSYHDDGHVLNLTWFYPLGDYDGKENGELFLEDASFPYQISEASE